MNARSTIRDVTNAVVRADTKLTQSAAAIKNEPSVRIAAWASKAGDQPPLRTLCALVIVGGLASRNRRLLLAGLRMLVAHEAATLAKNFVKDRIDRTRPRSASTKEERKPKPGRHRSNELRSFPSGHSAGSMAVARAFAREYPEYQLPALLAAVGVAAVQVPRFTHYGTDVAAGLLIGAAAEAAANAGWTAAAGAIAELDRRD